jgi:putative transposase
MPSKNSVKIYAEEGVYHLYNRGVDKRIIFKDKSDCTFFLRLLKQYLSPKDSLKDFINATARLDRITRSNMHGEIELLGFALMSNHFHLLVKQTVKDGISKFMGRLLTSYAIYFNKKYSRVGHLFQDRYKGAIILNDSYLLHLSRYIHLNPRKINSEDIDFNEFSSYSYYLKEKTANWVNTRFILDYFEKENTKSSISYKNFTEEYSDKTTSEDYLGELILDEE